MLDVPAAVLDREFGSETVRRGRAYVDAGRVLSHQVASGHDGVLVTGAVQGSGSAPYQVSVRVASMRRGVEVWSVCTCPVALGCKHSAAVLLLAQRGSDSPSRWARDLDEMLGALEITDVPGAGGPVPLALRVEVRTGTPRWQSRAPRTLSLRPLQRGKLGGWIKTGADWRELPSLRYAGEHDPVQVEALTALGTALGTTYGGQPALSATGVTLWSLLRRVTEAGVPLVAGHGVTEVEVLTEPVEIATDLTAEDDGLVLELVVRDGTGRAWAADAVEPLGRPVHGLALLTPAPAPARRRSPHAALTLAPLARVLPEPVERLLRRAEPVRVPAAERAAFEESYLPRLRRRLGALSSDGSVRLPDEPAPELVLELEWLAPGRAAGSFAWDYGDGPGQRRFGIASAAGLADLRRPEHEREHLAGLGLDEHATALLCDAAGRLREQQLWEGPDLLRFVEAVLPTLRDHEAVRLEESGEQPDYRPAAGDPVISFVPADETSEETGRRTDWLDLEVLIRVDGEPVPLGMVLTALTRGTPIVFLPSGLHVRADHPAFEQLAELVTAARELLDQPDDRLRVGRRDLGAWAALDELGVVDAQAAAWVAQARALLSVERLPEVPEPQLASTLRAYQRDGFRWLAFLWQAGLGGVLADDMGLGKTLQALALISHARAGGAEPFLVVAPTSVVSAWAGEAARHAPGLVVRTITATLRKRGVPLAELVRGADVVVTSYALLRLEAADYAACRWGGLVLDEAQQVKNHQAKAYRAVREIDAPFRLALTGTPFENRLMELWSLLSVAAPGLYPSPQRFRESVVRPVESGDAAALGRLQRRIRPFLLRRTKELVAPELPAKQEQLLAVTLTPKHRRVYDTHLQRERQAVLGLLEEDFEKHRIAIFRSLTRLRMLSLDAGLVDPAYDAVGSAKIDLLVNHVRELAAEGHRALVFSQFTSFLQRVRARLEDEGLQTCYLDGRTRDRAGVVEEFRAGNAPVFLISLKAGGVGLTLTEADYVFVLDPWWNPAVEAQAVDRAHRIGQERPVVVYRLVAADTIEEKVVALKERKAALFAQVMDGGAGAEPGLAPEDVRALLEQ
ncbi:MAG: DEAD/DEAH box helicase [Marmoricola sp.]